MGTAILRGISLALLVTILTLLAGILWTAMGMSGLSLTRLIDIGLLLSCLAGGYRSGKESGLWLVGGLAGAGYVALGVALLALFLPVNGWGTLQVLGEGTFVGLIAGAVGMNYSRYGRPGLARQSRPSWPAFSGLGFSPVRGDDDNYAAREAKTGYFGRETDTPDGGSKERDNYVRTDTEDPQLGDAWWPERYGGEVSPGEPGWGNSRGEGPVTLRKESIGSGGGPGQRSAWWEQEIGKEY